MKCIFLKQHDPPQSYTLSYAWISVHNQRPSYIGHYILGYIYLYMSGYRTGIDEADITVLGVVVAVDRCDAKSLPVRKRTRFMGRGHLGSQSAVVLNG